MGSISTTSTSKSPETSSGLAFKVDSKKNPIVSNTTKILANGWNQLSIDMKKWSHCGIALSKILNQLSRNFRELFKNICSRKSMVSRIVLNIIFAVDCSSSSSSSSSSSCSSSSSSSSSFSSFFFSSSSEDSFYLIRWSSSPIYIYIYRCVKTIERHNQL